MQLETFLNKYWSDFSIPLSPDCNDFIQNSYSEPFWEALFALHQKSRRTPLQSVRNQHYDFYHDCLVRHLLSNDVAYTQVETGSWSYKQIHRCVNAHIRNWSQHRPEPGQLIALVLQPGLEYLIALLTSLRLGLTLCFLPPSPFLGDGRIAKLLSELQPKFIVGPGGNLPIDLKGQEEENVAPLSFPYKANAIVQLSLALYRQEPLTFVPLDAHTLYSHCLRDAYVTLNLLENPVWAAPLSCPIRNEPCSTLMTLLAGAKRVHVADEQLKKDPALLKDEKIQLIGISKELFDLWSRTPGLPIRSLKSCFCSSLELSPPWKDFLKLNGTEKLATFSLLMDSSLGGISFHNRPNFEFITYKANPSLGTPWELLSSNGTKILNPRVDGTFSPKLSCQANSKKACNLTLHHFLHGTNVHQNLPVRDGVTFPIEEIETLVNNLPFVQLSCLLNTHATGHQFLLLVFIDPFQPHLEEADWSRQIREQIADQLGKGFVPDQIQFYPLVPSIANLQRIKPEITSTLQINRPWCEQQVLNQGLTTKLEQPIFQTIHQLKAFAAGPKMENLVK